MALPEQTLLDLIKVDDEQIVRSPAWYNELKAAINELITADFSKLVQLLYLADVSENKLKKQLEGNTNTDAAAVIANLLIERQIQKIKTKQSFQPQPPTGNEETW